MKRITLLAGMASAVTSLVLIGSTLGGGSAAALAVSTKKSPSPTPTVSPTPVVNSPGCFQVVDGSFFWHRDVIAGSTSKLNVGEFGATLWLGSGLCYDETYVFTLSDVNGVVLKTIPIKGSWDRANVASVTTTKVLHLGTTDGPDDADAYKVVHLTTQILDANGVAQFTSLDQAFTDSDENTSPATSPYR